MSRRLSRTDPKTGQRIRKRPRVERGTKTRARPGSLRGLVGQRPADDMERAMRAARTRARKQAAEEREPSRSERTRMQAAGQGHDALLKLGERIGAGKEPKARRAGAERAQKRSQGPSHTERWIPGPSKNWTEREKTST